MGATAGLFATVLSGYQTISTARAQGAQGSAEISALNTNATLADHQQADAIARGEIAAQQAQRNTRQLAGAQTVAYAGQGVDTNSGSAVDIRGDTAAMGAFDEQTIKHNATLAAWGYSVDAANYRTQAAQVKAATRNAQTSTLLTGAVQTFGIAKNAGLFARNSRSAPRAKANTGFDGYE